jgi:hypothetical protein
MPKGSMALGYNIPVSFSGAVGVTISDPYEVAYASPGQTLDTTTTPETTSTATAAEGNAASSVGGSASTSSIGEIILLGVVGLAAWFFLRKK